MSKKKIFNIGNCDCSIGDLKRALDRCNNDSKFNFVLCTNEPKKEDAIVYRLEDLCTEMYDLLVSTSMCIDVCAKEEEKYGGKSIYYEGNKGYNCGAKQLAKDVKDFLDYYHKERVQIDLMR